MNLTVERPQTLDVTKRNPNNTLFQNGNSVDLGSIRFRFDTTNPFPHIEILTAAGFEDTGRVVVEGLMLDIDLGLMFDQELNPMYMIPYP